MMSSKLIRSPYLTCLHELSKMELAIGMMYITFIYDLHNYLCCSALSPTFFLPNFLTPKHQGIMHTCHVMLLIHTS